MAKNRDIYSVKTDFNQSLNEMVEAGKYDWVSKYILRGNISIEGEGVEESRFMLITSGKPWTSYDEAMEEIERQNLRPATFPELLSFGAQYPEFQRKYPITAIGTEIITGKKITDGSDTGPGGYQRDGCLRGSATGRALTLYKEIVGWHGEWRFLSALP